MGSERLVESLVKVCEANAELGMALVDKMIREDAVKVDHLDTNAAHLLRFLANHLSDEDTVLGVLGALVEIGFDPRDEAVVTNSDEERAALSELAEKLAKRKQPF